ncbi:hypothetical protein L3Q82_014138 [Scortum barcoo]|uniref:Uncharacterized protein n=1 Tax=Scortum barcoo TaxID=214431 RepID=A0ACB8VZ18_9TELE|nr:hypothetical protein L3Q82_014138 [Scortum barcoo]
MLGTLCTLITALTCVSGVTVLTQKPPVVTIPGGVPQYVLRFYHSYSSPTYGSGFSSPKFTSTHQSTSDYRLIINNVEEGDSAVYYCQHMGRALLKTQYFHTQTFHSWIFLCLLTDVDAVIVLTQTPAVHTVSTGQEVVLRCNVQRDDGNWVNWYKQVPGEAPQYVLAFHHGSSSLSFGSGFSSDRFNSKSSSNIDYQFIIKWSEAGDSAVYYCQTWDNSAQEHVSQ